MTEIEQATEYAIAEMRAERNVTEEDLVSIFKGISKSFGAAAAMRAANKVIERETPRVRPVIKKAPGWTSPSAAKAREQAYRDERAVTGIPLSRKLAQARKKGDL